MTERQMLEQIAGGSCFGIDCIECPIMGQCNDYVYNFPIHNSDDIPEAQRSAARAKLAEMDKGQDNSIVDIQPLREIVTLHRMRGGEYGTIELTTAQFDAIFDMVKAIVDILGYCQLASLVAAQDMGVIKREEVDQIRTKSVKEAPDA